MLLCGGLCTDDKSCFEVVLDSDSMILQHTLLLDSLSSVKWLLSLRGEVWGRLDKCSVVVWGMAKRGPGSKSGISEAGRA